MQSYKTVSKEGSEEQVIEKSKFIVHVKPVETKEEAEKYISIIRKQYKDATHNVPAMVLGDAMQVQWASDDGEPQGTAGAPIVQYLVANGITNIVVIVTRYFGGIKLGTGGLVRAYTNSAKLGIEKTGLCQVKEVVSIKYQIDYSFISPIQNQSGHGMFRITNSEYGEHVVLTILFDEKDEEGVISGLTNITSGQGKILAREMKKIKIDLS